jgi:hypothetical protein
VAVQQDGTCGASFLTFLTDLENDGILVLHRGEALPPRLKGPLRALRVAWTRPRPHSCLDWHATAVFVCCWLVTKRDIVCGRAVRVDNPRRQDG